MNPPDPERRMRVRDSGPHARGKRFVYPFRLARPRFMGILTEKGTRQSRALPGPFSNSGGQAARPEFTG